MIHQKGLVVPDHLRERIEKKVGKIDYFFEDDVEVVVRLMEERGARKIAEITINLMDGTVLRVEEVSADMYASVDKAIDVIVRQIRKHRTKLEKRLRAGAFDSDAVQGVEVEDIADPEESNELVRVKRFELKPMTVEDAIAQMDLLGHSFFLFVDSGSNITCVVYRRKDGKIGMLQPTNG